MEFVIHASPTRRAPGCAPAGKHSRAPHLSGSFSVAGGTPAAAALPGVRPCPPACGCRGIHWLGGAVQSRALRMVVCA